MRWGWILAWNYAPVQHAGKVRLIQVASQYRRARNFGLTKGWFPVVGSIVWYASLLFCNARGKVVGISGFCKGDLPDGVYALTEFPEAE